MVSSTITAEIRADALRANIRAIRRRVPVGAAICAAVKANAYGHGVEEVLGVLAEERVEQIAVASLAEAMEARRLGWTRPVLCLGAALMADSAAERLERCEAVISADLHCTVTTLEEARLLSDQASRLGRPARVEIKVDTGMGRSGIRVDLAVGVISQIATLKELVIEGVYTHLATADEQDLSFAREQLRRFVAFCDDLGKAGVGVTAYHAANSAAVFRLPEARLDRVRPGLAVYGYWGGPNGERPSDLVPSMRVTGRVAAVRRLPAGHAVGYGCTFTTARESTIAVVPIGYADGYRRALSGDAVMTLEPTRGQPRRMVPVVGRVSMDQTTIDVTDAGDVRAGDGITIIDDDPAAPNSVEALARKLGTVPYEITCLIGRRIDRVLV